MKKLPDLCIVAAIVAILVGIISRLTLTPIVVESRAHIGFAAVMLLLAIALMLKEQLGSK